ncbi:MAG: hypothetical protein V1921_00790 [Candidatus Altiarchaeota archaeon]
MTSGIFEYAGEISSQISTVFETSFCTVYTVIWYLAGVLASAIIVVQGLKWVEADDDPGQRQRAKETIVNVIYALIFIIIGKILAELIIGETFNCAP